MKQRCRKSFTVSSTVDLRVQPRPVLPWVLVTAALIFPARPAQAQATPETVIRSETRVVLVDAVATDKKNKPALDLTQKDFRIWEDGKEQKITSFSLESAGVSPERSSRHYTILFFDTSTLGPSTLLAAKKDATRFVDTFASPDRYMAVISFGGDMRILQNFTPDAQRLDAALAKLESFTATGAAPTGAPGRGARNGPVSPTFDPLTFRSMLNSIRSVAASVAAIRDRKALVLFSGGISGGTDISTDVISTIDACNKANVAVYGVLGRGLIGRLTPPRATPLPPLALGFQGRFPTAGGAATVPLSNTDASGSQINLDAPNQDVVRTLVNGTGGLMLGTTNNLPEELGNITQEQDDYYLLGYTPAIESAEGTCHSLQVKVDRGLSVRARKGYCTEKPADALLGKPTGKDLEARASGTAAGNIAVSAQLPWFYSGPNEARVDVAIDFVPRAVPFRKDKDGLHGEIDLAGIAYKSDGSVAARLSDTVKLSFATQQEADAFVKTPYHYTNQFEIVPGQYNFRMAVAPEGASAQEFGKLDSPLAIDLWNGKTLAMSGVALSHETHPVASPARSDDLSLERVGPLVSNGIEVVPAGSNEFRVGEKGFFYFEVYASAPPPSLSVRVRVLDRATGRQIDDSGPMKADSFIKPGTTVIPIAMTLPIVSAGLPAGVYKVEVTAAGLTRTADFDVK
jgi:VWFA-related protein